jgi:hypothetical protein
MSSNDIVFDPARRQVLPLSAAIRPVRFARRNWEISQQVREILDSWDTGRPVVQPAPRPVADDQNCESIIMEGSQIQRTWRKTGAFEVRQHSTTTLGVVEDAPAPLAFAVVADTGIRDAASAALEAINSRKPHGRRAPREPAKPLTPPTSTRVLVLGFILAGVVVGALLYVAKTQL